MGDKEVFKAHLGKQVVLYGKPFDGMTTMVAKAFVVREVVESETPSEGGVEVKPVADIEMLTLTGTVEFKDIEGGFYAVDGFALVGVDEKILATLVGQKVVVQATRDSNPSIIMVERARVTKLMREVTAQRTNFKQLTFNGKFAKLDQGAEVVDGVLMVPLRAVVEGLGGAVQWDASTRAVTVEMSDRMAYFWLGQDKAEMNQNNVRYITRNMIAMAKAPVIKNGRTMISADAITQILGLYETVEVDGTLNITSLR